MFVGAGSLLKSLNDQRKTSHPHGYRRGVEVGFIQAADYDTNTKAQHQDSHRLMALESHRS